MRKKIYLALINQLKTIQDDAGTPVIKHFDLWNQNVEFMDQEQPAFFPLCFIEFMPIKWEHLSGGVRMATFTIRLHIVAQWLYPTEDGSDFQEKGLEYLDLLDDVNRVLHQFSGDGFGSLSCTKSITNHNHTGIIEDIEEFETCVKDESAVRRRVKLTDVVPNIRLKTQG